MNLSDTPRGGPPNPGFREVGTGMPMTFVCDRCSKNKTTRGRRLKLRCGVRFWWCAGCCEEAK